MSLADAIVGAVADLINIAVNVIAKKLGYSEVKVQKIEVFLGWVILLIPLSLLLFITFKYS
ncbi:hypothetical protein [Methylotenera sp.]|uniref:hypothetical protein n=1 Tax=Methylotenera sp. TaxID=2051956 RepID=UPI002488B59C|nr:hypothetical protein [Methylotenera sp.]MDI1362273.1 hypothetical protein [Methylotenera sp.]